MILIGGSSSRELAVRVAEKTNIELAEIDFRKFPDNEIYIRLFSDVSDKKCIVIHTTRTNDDIIELFLLLDLLRDLGAGEVHTIVPYLAYSRQDKRFNEGEALSAKTILKLINKFSDSITTVNCHFLDSEGEFMFHGIKIKNLDAFPLVAEYFRKKFKKPVVVSPDKGALRYAKGAANIIRCDFDYLEKKRISDDKVVMSVRNLDVYDKDVIILDDIISTGTTIIEAVKILRKYGARSISAGCVHGVFSHGIEKLNKALDNLVCTDTIQTQVSKVSISSLIAENLKQK
ncbi:MAG: ribose-phosphate diphosphokinase [Candidatus Altiarchaeales archaeon]|nr:MAG: ribose-phosphate diphosphokinase [Candidatus Altiarchaeales archaeon]RLI94851.1 MAG: ribose-phosphate diphosphokinase [Candidatus Altiarchaeales archaeon]RLI95138.1 MAG: ribose-phosphate diphosphokinase [Candidatus Altiarchaeales archaeon]HDO82871.1 ribose-phosphate diphosphokinase [Candidatus Altiarchaeales archaeon]HEX55520.1 ribose-phosphate diphosphokinase [Candidatus Altiarchaeales archaeon]